MGDIREIELRIAGAVLKAFTLGDAEAARRLKAIPDGILSGALMSAAPMFVMACRKKWGGCGFRAIVFTDREVKHFDRCPSCGMPNLRDPEAVQAHLKAGAQETPERPTPEYMIVTCACGWGLRCTPNEVGVFSLPEVCGECGARFDYSTMRAEPGRF